ncbi:MAG: type 4a pilus biogenesis protein PilO [Candidatus Wallbacteria bacterium]|nr:type 4a pilus biogenesis protein PilO [Candidatus Wallbacteria bacterium]
MAADAKPAGATPQQLLAKPAAWLLLANLTAAALFTVPAVSESALLAEHEQALANARSDSRRRTGVQDAALRETAAALEGAELRLPAERDLPALADRIRSSAATSGLELLHADYRTTTQETSIHATLDIELTAQGPYRSLKAFLLALESDPSALAITSLTALGGDGVGTASRKVRLSLRTLLKSEGVAP